jgi:hypothetical protein
MTPKVLMHKNYSSIIFVSSSLLLGPAFGSAIHEPTCFSRYISLHCPLEPVCEVFDQETVAYPTFGGYHI